MKPIRRYLVVGSLLTALAGGGIGAAAAVAGGDDGEREATGPQADAARAAALDLYSGARANSVERDSENGATWEVEVTRTDGSTVDVRLDEGYKLVVVESDSESEDSLVEGDSESEDSQ